MSTMNSPTSSISTTPPKSSLARLVYQKHKTFKVMVLGQAAIGKSALVVRFITRRFIGDYDPTLEDIYPFQAVMDHELVNFQILDSAGELRENEYVKLEAHIRWADAFILMFSVTDKCSYDECHRLKFLINYNKRRWRLTSVGFGVDNNMPLSPVVLVGNKSDMSRDRMVTTEDGKRLSKEIGCVCFHEISVRESIQQCWDVFHDARRFWRVSNKWGGWRNEPSFMGSPARPLLARSVSTSSSETENTAAMVSWSIDLDEEDEEWDDPGIMKCIDSTSPPPLPTEPQDLQPVAGFRARSCTDSKLPARVTRPRHPPAPRPHPALARRMSVAMKGDKANP